jgi:hypothetical protein
MIRLWRKLIVPVLEAANVKSILEIGAESGTSTNALLRFVADKQGCLYCIDPAPDFDSDELQRKHPESLKFYRDLSLNVLPGHKMFDVAMVDGDHNWYTVYNELLQIEEIHEHDPIQQPIVFIHDIAWPYGRRDLYYNPATIPMEYQQPYESNGILLGKSELSSAGGINLDLCNATHEGGKRNGVLTAVEDYITESALEYKFIHLPLYFGLGILVTKQRLEANPKLRSVIDHIESDDGLKELVALAEHLRCVDISYGQAVTRRLSSANARIAELEEELKDAVSDKLRNES